ncbi:MAG TPA: transketolase C-terminal domain-containing protein [Candidatus Paceibacterota bacterium]|nr:transketolase C-terminal domain-containing protein [Candidatus Paceibacterota bacterium]HPT40230.1 transketolase C-terminal domain-containing protein [Candidatus Paceibacterota bacterium]
MINPIAKLNEKILSSDVEQQTTREGFGEGTVLAGKEDSNIVMLCADITESVKASTFRNAFPDRFIETGIAEQNLMGLAAGMAMVGKVPFVATYAVFSPGRNWDQLRVSVCYSKANVKIVGAHTGVSVGPDGATHQALEDIAITRCLPNLVVIAPCDAIESKKSTYAAAKHVGPVYLRFEREKTPIMTTEESPFEIGKAIVWRDADKPVVAIIGCGPILHNAMLAAEELAQEGIEIMVINNHTIKPMDSVTIIEAAKKCGAVVTVENHQVAGGMGSAVAEILSENYPVPMEFVGVKDRFGESGSPSELIEAFGLGVTNIKEAVKKVITRKI